MAGEIGNTYRFIISCPDQVGIVAKVTQFIADHGGWLTEASYHSDPDSGWFFMRNVVRTDSLDLTIEEFRLRFDVLAQELKMNWYIHDAQQKRRVALLVSHSSHCLADLLHRWYSGELQCDIPCVISNHDNLSSMVEWHGIPFHHVPINKDNKSAAFDEIDNILTSYDTQTVVLARYMQIIPPAMCEKYSGQMINIHHSFLPSFIGANPYQKAYERGVKLIGATSHYVTHSLDEGPIIDQDVIRINHDHSQDDMVRLGRDVEKTVLARALRFHIEDRVIIKDNKTIVF
ncbi:MAG: formyltetrahydrofolate deformylase [Pseudomonadales bacterium]|jgi:formyltetrahydrofolate deformylase